MVMIGMSWVGMSVCALVARYFGNNRWSKMATIKMWQEFCERGERHCSCPCECQGGMKIELACVVRVLQIRKTRKQKGFRN